MKPKTKKMVFEWLMFSVIWVFIMFFYYLITFWGLFDFLEISIVHSYLTSKYIIFEACIQGVVFGFLFGVLNTVLEKSALRKRSMGVIIFSKTVLYSIAMMITEIMVINVFEHFDILTREEKRELIKTAFSPRLGISIMIFFIFCIGLINFLYQVNKKFGHRNLMNLIMGKYSNPVEENRIFMFLDLRGSTTIAEKFGHKTYSKFIRDCYYDLTNSIIEYKAEVYQYIGDGVVLTWGLEEGLKNLNCFRLFFDFEDKLEKRREFYMKKYFVYPDFKAGMDMGEVTVSEIGEIKREIAYHGDVINTAARIEKQCSKMNKKLLISEYIADTLDRLETAGFEKKFEGDVKLAGKEHILRLYSICRMNKPKR